MSGIKKKSVELVDLGKVIEKICEKIVIEKEEKEIEEVIETPIEEMKWLCMACGDELSRADQLCGKTRCYNLPDGWKEYQKYEDEREQQDIEYLKKGIKLKPYECVKCKKILKSGVLCGGQYCKRWREFKYIL